MSLRILAAGAALAALTGLAAAAQTTTTSPAETASSGGKGDSTVTSHQQQDPTIGSGQLTGQGASSPSSAGASHGARLKSHHVKRTPRSTSAGGGAATSEGMGPGGPGSPPPTLPTPPNGAGSADPSTSGGTTTGSGPGA